MIVLKNPTEKSIFFDCDDTLVMWGQTQSPNSIKVELNCKDKDDSLSEFLVPHKKHIDLLKLRKEKGDKIFVWSAAGWDWALSVVKALGIEEHVDYVLSKPFYVVDDLPTQFMHRRIYYEFKNE